jgi:hypothetical protein
MAVAAHEPNVMTIAYSVFLRKVDSSQQDIEAKLAYQQNRLP